MMPTTEGGRPLVGIETGSLSKLNAGAGPEIRCAGAGTEGSAPVIGFVAPTIVCPTRSRRDSRFASSLAGRTETSWGRWDTAGARIVVSTGASGNAYFWYETKAPGAGSRSAG